MELIVRNKEKPQKLFELKDHLVDDGFDCEIVNEIDKVLQKLDLFVHEDDLDSILVELMVLVVAGSTRYVDEYFHMRSEFQNCFTPKQLLGKITEPDIV